MEVSDWGWSRTMSSLGGREGRSNMMPACWSARRRVIASHRCHVNEMAVARSGKFDKA